ncbi:Inactive poly (ADP-ribose) polymerase RCD1 [Ananas comosus]|uniref:Inactive poly (ADP-ribose) polymerase RCD1 n=2 Tax=Ananas comosus TaxID=4615 RepID=A0A199UZC3_ANACO|nr:Inactive poly (ADP-ribose) polymerase RCD1 [Ananas comosus]
MSAAGEAAPTTESAAEIAPMLLRTRSSAVGAKDRAFEVPLAPGSDLASGFSSLSDLVRGFRVFRRSAAPARFLCFSGGGWVDIARHVFDVLRQGFVRGRTSVEASVDGKLCVFDFLRMVRVELETGEANSIAWIDVDGKCFFPRTVLDDQRKDASFPKLEIAIRIAGDSSSSSSDCNSKKKRDFAANSTQEWSDESPEASAMLTSERVTRWTNLEALDGGDRYYKVVEKLFLAGMRRHAPNTVVTSIRKCSHASRSTNCRLRAFQLQTQMMGAVRGDGNVKFGWFGGSASDVAAIAAHGFGKPNNGSLGPEAHGVGVHLTPPHSPYRSALLSEADEKGEQHIVLCRVLMGRTEQVSEGSSQFHPSSDEYDSGVDDLKNPRWYIVWSTHMNTHILPEYVVTYRSSNKQQSSQRIATTERKPLVVGLCFPKLFSEIGSILPSSGAQNLEIWYKDFKEGKMRKDVFIKSLRALVGDKALASLIKKIRGY